MKIIIKNGSNFNLTSIPNSELELIKKNNEVITNFVITDEEEKKINWGCTFVYDWDFKIIETDKYLLRIKKQSLEKMSELELLETSETFWDLNFNWKDKWDLLVEKFFWWNMHKESQLTRYIIAILIKVAIKKEELNDQDLLILQSLEKMNKKAEVILKKFN